MQFMLHAQQNDSLKFWDIPTTYQPQRGRAVGIGISTTYLSSFIILNRAWYADYPREDFHFFNDFDEWNQMDKVGHIGSAYYLSRWTGELIRWTGTNPKKAAIEGASVGFLYQLTVEIMDGYSSQWGFSVGDLTANTIGSALYLSQELAWKDQRISVKFSYHGSCYAQYNPALLGDSWAERILKDYNGQTYWLSANVSSFLSPTSKFPKWLAIDFGYGADGMTGAVTNDSRNVTKRISDSERIRQYYIAPDIDLTKIPFRSGFLKGLSSVFGFVKIPAPTLSYQSNGIWKFYPIYF